MTINPICQACEDWSKCPRTFTWFSIAECELHYCRTVMLWLIERLPDLENRWPPESEETGYTDPDIQRSVRPCAPFERVRQVRAEVLSRLKLTKRDGLNLIEQVQQRQTLTLSSRNALNYIVGSKRKKDKYLDWLRKREYREMRRAANGHE